MMTLQELERYVRSQRPGRPRRVEPREGARGGTHGASAVALSRSRALMAPGGRRVLALSRPLDYEIPGIVEPLRQPSRMSCWATTFTMMVSWRDQASYPIESALGRIARKWVDLFKADTGSSAEDEAELFAASGLVAEPLVNHLPESWEVLLRQYGPLAVIVDVNPGQARAMHMLIVVGVHGDGSTDGTTITLVDPARGDRRAVRFRAFVSQYEQGAQRRTASGRHNQIIHWPKDVRFAADRGLAAPRALSARPVPPTTPATLLAPRPWSHFFPFRKGSTFDVDGPYWYNGTGEVIERTPNDVKFTLRMPSLSFLGQEFPAADVTLEATYRKEGKGNLVRATINGVVLEDPDAEITSSVDARIVRPKFTAAAGPFPLPDWIRVGPDGSDVIDLDVSVGGSSHNFELKRTTGSSGLALAVDPWSRFFPFASGTAFAVGGPLGFDGHGQVLERSDTVLKVETRMPAMAFLGRRLPALEMLLEAHVTGAGAGNRVDLTVNGAKHSDPDASIRDDAEHKRRTIVLSSSVPGSGVGAVAFAPDGRDRIDFGVTIAGKEHGFTLKKIKGVAALSWVRGLASASTIADAVREVASFAARSGGTRWKLSRADVAKRLDQLVRDADLVDQGGLNLCGPAAFFHVLAKRDPVAFARYAADLFEKGVGTIGTLTIRPDDDLVLNDYAAIVPRMSSVTPPAEWMCLSALRDATNRGLDFEGDPSESVAGMTTPGELADWMKGSGIYTKVSNEGNWVATKGLAHAVTLRPAPDRDVLMLINANLIAAAHPGKKKIVDSFPNHFIQLLSTIASTASGTVAFDYWTWGLKGKQHAVVNARDFINNYYGTVTGEV